MSLPLAIQPCECTTPATLLTLLITTCQKICDYRSKFFGSNRRNAKESIRQIELLLNFFEEIQDWESENLPDSVALVLSELHLIFQKILYLLEDCALEGARLLMLMKFETVANRFRILTRSIGLAMEVLPLDLIDVPIEVKEHVELVIKQARRGKFEIDGEDEEILNEVRLILNLFEFGTNPNRNQIKCVLDYIGIRNWNSCHKEVKFLDSEIELECSSRDKREISLLISLMGLMSYSRVVVFDHFDEGDCEKTRRVDRCRIKPVVEFLNPDDFRCPISLDFMIDPVTTETGQSYDRASIQKWLKSGNLTCPKTGERLKNRDLVPNLALRQIIQQYCSQNSIPFPDSIKPKHDKPKRVVADCSISEKIHGILANFLSRVLESGEDDEQNRAVYEIKLLSKSRIFNRSCIAEFGLIPNLLKQLKSQDDFTQKNAIGAVFNLSKHSKTKRVIAENRGLNKITKVLNNGYRIESRQLAAGALFYMLSIDRYREIIGEIPDSIRGLINLLKDKSDRSKKNAMVAIYVLLLHPENNRKLIAAGVVPLLVNLLKNSDSEMLITDSMEILKTLVENPDGAAEILRNGGLNLIIGFLESCSSRAGQENSVSLLVALCINGGSEVVRILSENEMLISSLYKLLSEGTNRARGKANSLIRAIHEYCDLVSLSSDSFELQHLQEQIVHAW